ncbi:hypothetical protein [Rhizobium sp. BK251]|uniref:Pepco domain-containing protein n=1 Tax=Rhizobium sp. BK251 TaxID=2512125 RepID=UPI0010DAC7D5|nr:hypothetical protein [Rhizobium sp. BK251]TCL74657.1 hypothetical protein EV286_102218 [Rhizobium sp. BK251]
MDRQIKVITDADPVSRDGARSGDDVGGGFGSRQESGAFRMVSLSAEGLRNQVSNLLEVVQYAFDQTMERSALSLDQLELSVEISSEGQISILGTGGKAGGRGAIKMVFKREKPGTKLAAVAGDARVEVETAPGKA